MNETRIYAATLVGIGCRSGVFLVLRTAFVPASFVFEFLGRQDGSTLARPQHFFLDRHFWKLLFQNDPNQPSESVGR